MATKREWQCPHGCTPAIAGQLFDALLSIAENSHGGCLKHSKDKLQLRLEFDLGLGAAHSQCTVIGAFVPRKIETWTGPNDSHVSFYPFLVILKRHGRKQAAWLPYWHIVKLKSGQIKKKYGQWAPFLDAHLFDDLLEQAHAEGFISVRGAKVV